MFTIVVRGTPSTQGSKKWVPRRNGDGQIIGGNLVDDNGKALGSWRETVRSEAAKAMDGQCPMDDPVVLDVMFTVKKPKSAPRTRTTWPSKKPDTDKLLRAVMDALKEAGVYTDDARVVLVRAGKQFPVQENTATALTSPGAIIRVASIHEFQGASDGQVTAG